MYFAKFGHIGTLDPDPHLHLPKMLDPDPLKNQCGSPTLLLLQLFISPKGGPTFFRFFLYWYYMQMWHFSFNV